MCTGDDFIGVRAGSRTAGPVEEHEGRRAGKVSLINNLDWGALATYCGACAMWAEAMEPIQKYGTMVKSPSGFPIQSPYLAIANRQAEIMMRICVRVRFHPRTTAGRSRGTGRVKIMIRPS